MKRALMLSLAAGVLLLAAGCIAVSAREVHTGFRYDAVATPDGRIFVVDKVDCTAREAARLHEAAGDDYEIR